MAKARMRTEDVANALRGALDPEIGISIVDMGLIYGIKIDSGNNVEVKITMTSQMCPVASIIISDVQTRVESIPGVGKVKIDLVWDPPWSPEMMTDEYRLSFGMQ
jgi:metal-sulfur cluster biosynthetic enzyme